MLQMNIRVNVIWTIFFTLTDLFRQHNMLAVIHTLCLIEAFCIFNAFSPDIYNNLCVSLDSSLCRHFG